MLANIGECSWDRFRIILHLSASLSAALTACATQTYQPKTVEGAQCKMQCYTSIGGELGGIPYAQKMNNCLSACADIERLKAEGR